MQLQALGLSDEKGHDCIMMIQKILLLLHNWSKPDGDCALMHWGSFKLLQAATTLRPLAMQHF